MAVMAEMVQLLFLLSVWEEVLVVVAEEAGLFILCTRIKQGRQLQTFLTLAVVMAEMVQLLRATAGMVVEAEELFV
jgi:hypothetical protein